MPAHTITLPRQLGMAVRNQRKRLDLTQAQLAERAHVSRRLITNLELGDADGIALNNILRILGALDMDLSVKWQEPPETPQPQSQIDQPRPSTKQSEPSYQEALDGIVAAALRQAGLDAAPAEKSR